MLKILNDLEQGSEEWHQARCGVVTASEFSSVLAQGRSGAPSKTRQTYLMKIVGEKITGNPTESFSNAHMERGHVQEPIAMGLYETKSGNAVEKIGFMVNGDIGYSPDGLIGDDGLIEIKSKLAHLQAQVILDDKVPSEHRAQIQGGLMVSGRKWVDFVCYCPGMPLFVQRVERDDEYIANLRKELTGFQVDVTITVNRIMELF